MVPPRDAVIHQHRLGQAALRKGLLQMLAHQRSFGPRRGRKRDQIAAVIVDHRQGRTGRGPVLRPLEVHLPKLVRLLALEAPHGGPVPVSLAHQPVAQQDPMHRARRQLDPLAGQQHGQLARAPVRINLAQGTDAGLQIGRSLRGRMLGATTVLFDGRYAALPITPQPQITGWPRDAKLKTQPAERLRATQGTNDKLHTLLSNFHLLPRHRFSTSARAKV
jgi:hypothetical protein